MHDSNTNSGGQTLRLERLTVDHIEQIWPRLRVKDIQEITMQGTTRETAIALTKLKHAFAAYVDNRLAAIFGAAVHVDSVNLWFVATEDFYRYPRMATRRAIDFLRWIDQEEGSKPAFVEVWSKYTDSIEWLCWLGFSDTGRRVYYGEEEFMIYRWN